MPIVIALSLTGCMKDDRGETANPLVSSARRLTCKVYSGGSPCDKIVGLLQDNGWDEGVVPTWYTDGEVRAYTTNSDYSCDAHFLMPEDAVSYRLIFIRDSKERYRSGPKNGQLKPPGPEIEAGSLPATWLTTNMSKKQFLELLNTGLRGMQGSGFVERLAAICQQR